MILELARFAAVVQRAFVFMVDQADLAGFDEDATKIFKRAIDALYRVVSEVPSAVAVIACLSDLYDKARIELNRPALDRLERDPPIAKLQINRSYAEIEAVVSRRLSCLFAEHGTVSRPEDPVYPIPRRELQQHENRRLRDVLEWCHEFQTQCALAGKIITSGDDVGLVRGTPPKQDREADLDQIAATWHDQRHSQGLEVPDEDDGILDVVVAAAKAYADEVGLSIAMPRGGGVRRIELSAGADSVALAIAVTNGSYRGGAFTRQIEALRRARRAIPVAIRTLEFPRGPVCDKAVSKLMNKGGGGVYVDGSTMRVLVAFQQFQPPFPADRVSAWQRRDRPIKP
jgi:hypothetical protein